jgi:tetratricopeptide (TPR) repeat protein
MKSKVVLLVASIVFSTTAFAQKDELKTLKKIYGREKISDSDMELYKTTLTAAEPLVAGSNEDDKVYFAYYKGVAPILELTSALLNPAKSTDPLLISKILSLDKVNQFVAVANATKEYEKKSGKQVYTSDINLKIIAIQPILVNYAVALLNIPNFKDASDLLVSIYDLDKTDVDKLYFAANYAVSAKEYDKALKYYQELKSLNYSGECTQYFGKNILTEKEDYFGNTPEAKVDRDKKVELKLYSNPRDEKIPSKRPEIFKNIALINVDLGKISEAKESFKSALSEMPNDSNLAISCSEFYLSQKEPSVSRNIILESIERNPKNVDLLFQLGVIYYNSNQPTEAKNSFLKVVEINPNYPNVYFNLALIILDDEKLINAKIIKLTDSQADMKKYNVLKKQLEEIYKIAIPYLKKANENNPENRDVLTTLINIYGALDMLDEAKALKAQLKK